MDNTDMRKLMNLVESVQLNEDAEQFSKDKVMNSAEVSARFGDVFTEYRDAFKNGTGVYKVESGSRGYIEDVDFVGKSPTFEYRDYSGDFDGMDSEFDDEDDEAMGFDDDEFTGTYWDEKVFEVGKNEEESDVYFYWSGQ